MTTELVNALKMVAGEKAIKIEDLIQVIEEAVCAAAAKRLERENLAASFDQVKGEFDLFEILEIKELVENGASEISLAAALEINPEARLGEKLRRQVQMEGLGRIAAQSVRQMIHKKGRELEQDRLYAKLKSMVGSVLTGRMIKLAGESYLFETDMAEAVLPKEEQLDLDRLERGKNIKLLLVDAERGKKDPVAIVSRTRPELLARLIAIESPEVAAGEVEIVIMARDSSGRSKVAVRSKKPGVDAVGACVGVRGGRIQPIVAELSGEKIDLFEWTADPVQLMKAAMTPARDLLVIPMGHGKKACVVAPESQLSLAIGKRGVNIRLATRITGWEMDVISRAEYEERKRAIHHAASPGAAKPAEPVIEEGEKPGGQ
jgi:N utilization substance protein A